MRELGWPAWVALPFAVSVAGTWIARGYALRRRLIDQPGARRSHAAATPRGGGVGIVAAMLLAFAVFGAAQPWVGVPVLPSAIALGLLLVAAVGWIDDHHPLSPWTRLLVHVLAAACLGAGLLAAGTGWPVALAGAGFAVVLTNVWNFMDGIDGIAVTQALLVALAYALFARGTASSWLALALAAACAGFLPFNLPPARIFLGDVGSGALGYLLAALMAWSATRKPDGAPLLLLPLSAFMVDATLTLMRRLWHRERWWLPHTQHAYQRWVRRPCAHGVVMGAYGGWTLGSLLLMEAVITHATAVKMLALFGCYLAGAMAWTRLQQPPPLRGT